MPELAFVVPDAEAELAADLAAALAEEVQRQDAVSLLCSGFREPRPDGVHVLLDAAAASGPRPGAAALARTIVVGLAPPGSAAFESTAELAGAAGAAFHVNSFATERLLEEGVPARHLQLGFSLAWELPDTSSTGLALVRDCGGYFDWVRVLRAIRRGEVVLHEHSLGMVPLVAGRHLFVGAPPTLDAIAATLSQDPARLERVRREAVEFLREALPLAQAAAVLIGAARTLTAQPIAPPAPPSAVPPLSSR